MLLTFPRLVWGDRMTQLKPGEEKFLAWWGPQERAKEGCGRRAKLYKKIDRGMALKVNLMQKHDADDVLVCLNLEETLARCVSSIGKRL